MATKKPHTPTFPCKLAKRVAALEAAVNDDRTKIANLRQDVDALKSVPQAKASIAMQDNDPPAPPRAQFDEAMRHLEGMPKKCEADRYTGVRVFWGKKTWGAGVWHNVYGRGRDENWQNDELTVRGNPIKLRELGKEYATELHDPERTAWLDAHPLPNQSNTPASPLASGNGNNGPVKPSDGPVAESGINGTNQTAPAPSAASKIAPTADQAHAMLSERDGNSPSPAAVCICRIDWDEHGRTRKYYDPLCPACSKQPLVGCTAPEKPEGSELEEVAKWIKLTSDVRNFHGAAKEEADGHAATIRRHIEALKSSKPLGSKARELASDCASELMTVYAESSDEYRMAQRLIVALSTEPACTGNQSTKYEGYSASEWYNAWRKACDELGACQKECEKMEDERDEARAKLAQYEPTDGKRTRPVVERELGQARYRMKHAGGKEWSAASDRIMALIAELEVMDAAQAKGGGK